MTPCVDGRIVGHVHTRAWVRCSRRAASIRGLAYPNGSATLRRQGVFRGDSDDTASISVSGRTYVWWWIGGRVLSGRATAESDGSASEQANRRPSCSSDERAADRSKSTS